MTDSPTFSLTGPLPWGRAAIEASAGTGKTYTLAGLVTRYVAEAGVPIEELLVVTFTRAAAAELRDRIRTRLTEAALSLRADAGLPATDELLAMLATTDRATRVARLERAVVEFDAATITTIHGFATQVLATLGSAAPGDPEAQLVDDIVTVVTSACNDILTAAAVTAPEVADQLPSSGTLTSLVKIVLGNPGIDIVPSSDSSQSTPKAAHLRQLVDETIAEIARRRGRAGTMSFDDVLLALSEALANSPAAREALRSRYRVALIDEFQDTDPVQWNIFSALFGQTVADRALVIVADPKQAIYAFRGANVHTYLKAAYAPGTDRSTLDVNRRSDAALLRSLDALLRGTTFGDDQIEFVPVGAAPDHLDSRLTSRSGDILPALRVRVVLGDGLRRSATKEAHVYAPQVARAIASDLALRVRELLEDSSVPGRPPGSPPRPLRPADVAVLITARSEAAAIQRALLAQGIPAVLARGTDVLESDAATQWRWLLNSLARPSDPTRARTVALSWFVGWSAEQIDAADDTELSKVQDLLSGWARNLDSDGVVEFCVHVRSESGVTARVLAMPDGDRDITDLDHIAELLQRGTVGSRATPAGLLALLDQLAKERSIDPENDVTARRVESEAEAVQIMTVFAAKGLEFPVVCVPTMWRASVATTTDVVYQDPTTDRRIIDIANREAWPTKADAADRKMLAGKEAIGENLRLLYVALTRARHQTLLWWTNGKGSSITGLARVLFARDGEVVDPAMFDGPKVTLPDREAAVSAIELALSTVGDAADVKLVGAADGGGEVTRWVDPKAITSLGTLDHAVLARVLERDNRRWSFTAISGHTSTGGPITSGTGHADLALALAVDDDSLGDAGSADESDDDTDFVLARFAEEHAATGVGHGLSSFGTDAAPDDGGVLPLGAVPGGAQFGTLVHEVLERVNFTAADLESEVHTHVAERMRWNTWPVEESALVTGLCATIESPLGPLLPGLSLRDLTLGDRLNELAFELRLGGTGRHPTDRDIGMLLLEHLAPSDPIRGWAEQLASGLFDVSLSGHLTGSIDAILRVHGPSPDGAGPAKRAHRYVVVDYKTNKLSAPGLAPQSSDYGQHPMAVAMAEHHYPLQALLYSVALHRYLRWRLPKYEPSLHLGGAAYLFVRGMSGSATPSVEGNPHGVFSWRVPPPLVTDLSNLLDGRPVTR